MYGSYGSYSSMSSAAETSSPINIGSGRSSTACAFPSWPNRACLGSGSSRFSSSSSYLSDEDLFLDDFEDSGYTSSGASSRSSSNASSISPPQGWRNAQQPFAVMAEVTNAFEALTTAGPSEDELAEIQRERSAYQRELVRAVLVEKERRKMAASAARRQRRAAAAAAGASPSASSRKKLAKLSAIAED